MTRTASQAQVSTAAMFTEPASLIEAYMASFVDERALPTNLREAIRYAVLDGGKRLRPTLTIRACEAVGGWAQAALAPATAIEMIHCFSLVHDDLPAMDDDNLRRGRPTLHRHTNEAMAILAGDAILALAFELIATRLEPAELVGPITAELATATNDMIAGQVLDTLGGHDPTDGPVESLRATHRHKTGALIRCAARMGALCGQADQAQLDSVTRYAEAIGLMFQVVDDLLDVTQTTESLGKAANKDSDQGKLTYPGLLGIEQSREEIARLKNEAYEALEPLGAGAHPLRALCDYLAVRQK